MELESPVDKPSKSESNESQMLKSSEIKENRHDEHESKQKTSREIEEAKIKNRKTVHDFLYFIEAVNNRFIISQLFADQAKTSTKRF